MEWSRVKTILILAMLGVNLLLLGNLMNTIWHDRCIERQALADAVAICEKQGVSVSEGAVGLSTSYPVYAEERDYTKEEAAARTILGEKVVRTAAGGGIVTYVSDTGSASFRNGGYVELRCTHTAMPESAHDAARAAGALLRRARLAPEDAVYTAREEAGAYIVEVAQRMDKKPVYNMSLTVTFSDGSAQVDGRLMAGGLKVTADHAKAPYEALLAFVSEAKKAESEAKRIIRVEQGYFASIATGGSVLYVPLWRVETDAGVYYFDLVKGQLVTVE